MIRMKISLVTQNTNLVNYLSTNPSLSVENTYTDLVAEYDKFINELNTVDVFLLIDYEDLSSSLAMLTKAIRSGSHYLFKPKEIVLVTNTEPSLSPTQNSLDKYMAFSEMLKENNLAMRLVTMEPIEFPGVYKAILRDTDWEGDDVQVYDKYKLKDTPKGISQRPKKILRELSTALKRDTRDGLVKQDSQTREGVEGVNIAIPERRMDAKNHNVSVSDLPKPRNNPELIIVTGAKYSGKTTACIRILNFMEKNGKSSLAVDTTGRRDLQRLLATENASFPVLKGKTLFEPVYSQVIGVQTFKPIYTAHFLDSIKNIVGASAPIFVEVDFSNVKSFLDTFPGRATVLVVLEYEFTKLRDTSLLLENEYPVKVIINSRSNEEIPEDEWFDMEDVVKNFIHNVTNMYSLSDMNFIEEILGGA